MCPGKLGNFTIAGFGDGALRDGTLTAATLEVDPQTRVSGAEGVFLSEVPKFLEISGKRAACLVEGAATSVICSEILLASF